MKTEKSNMHNKFDIHQNIAATFFARKFLYKVTIFHNGMACIAGGANIFAEKNDKFTVFSKISDSVWKKSQQKKERLYLKK